MNAPDRFLPTRFFLAVLASDARLLLRLLLGLLRLFCCAFCSLVSISVVFLVCDFPLFVVLCHSLGSDQLSSHRSPGCCSSSWVHWSRRHACRQQSLQEPWIHCVVTLAVLEGRCDLRPASICASRRWSRSAAWNVAALLLGVCELYGWSGMVHPGIFTRGGVSGPVGYTITAPFVRL